MFATVDLGLSSVGVDNNHEPLGKGSLNINDDMPW
jgi:hypothetical protein